MVFYCFCCCSSGRIRSFILSLLASTAQVRLDDCCPSGPGRWQWCFHGYGSSNAIVNSFCLVLIIAPASTFVAPTTAAALAARSGTSTAGAAAEAAGRGEGAGDLLAEEGPGESPRGVREPEPRRGLPATAARGGGEELKVAEPSSIEPLDSSSPIAAASLAAAMVAAVGAGRGERLESDSLLRGEATRLPAAEEFLRAPCFLPAGEARRLSLLPVIRGLLLLWSLLSGGEGEMTASVAVAVAADCGGEAAASLTAKAGTGGEALLPPSIVSSIMLVLLPSSALTSSERKLLGEATAAAAAAAARDDDDDKARAAIPGEGSKPTGLARQEGARRSQ